MRMLSTNEVVRVSGGLVQGSDQTIGNRFGDLGRYVYQLNGGDALETVDVIAQRDYCGSGFTSGVPDDPLGHEFREACKLHDGLFEILSGYYGKILADAIFLNAMLEWCNKNAPGDQSCRNMAYAYFAAVAVFGWPAYALAGTAGGGQ
jgi:hypothetical protein